MRVFVYTGHAMTMLEERGIKEDWVRLVLADPDKKERKEDGTVDYLRSIEEFRNRCLRVVVNTAAEPPRVITAFFDRRLRRKS